jgi:hypothetical protein
VQRLQGCDAARAAGAPTRFAPAELDGLPAPVARYFAFALTPGQPLVRRARLEHAGEFLVRAGAWNPFTSVEELVVRPPGFVWDATVRVAPLVGVRVRDSYHDGVGAMHGAVAGLVPVVDQRGTPEMAEASLQRYLAEAPWAPTALLPSQGVAWTPLDERSARATLTDGGVTAVVDFHFGDGGEIARTSAMRYRDVQGTLTRTHWVGHLREYARRDGMMVPEAGEVAWVLPDARVPYWRARITLASYVFAR